MQDNSFDQFRHRYATGEGMEAIATLIPHLDTSYDRWEGADVAQHRLLNYADALVYCWPKEALQLNRQLQSDLYLGAFQEALMDEEDLLLINSLSPRQAEQFPSLPLWEMLSGWQQHYFACRHQQAPTAGLVEDVPSSLRIRFAEHLAHLARWDSFKQQHLRFEGPPSPLPLVFPWGEQPYLPAGDLLLLMMEPVCIEWQRLEERPMILLFPDVVTLQQCLVFPEVEQLLVAPHCWWLLLDSYPAEQLQTQRPLPAANSVAFGAVAWRSALHSFVKPLIAAFTACVRSPLRECPESNWLYQVGCNLSAILRAHRLGHRRAHMHRANCSLTRWFGRYKGPPPAGVELGPSLTTAATPMTRSTLCRRSVNRVAHVVTQLVDGGHAPTRLYRTLMRHHQLPVSLLITDEYVARTSEYPLLRATAAETRKRGKLALAELKQLGVPVWFAQHQDDYATVAHAIAEELDRQQVDVAIFHIASPVNLMAARLAQVPCRVLFDHGDLPPQAGFDLYLSSNTEEQHWGLDGAVEVLPHVVDVEQGWESDPYPASYFGLPEEAQMLTTISFHLDIRLSEPMCTAVAQILADSPNAYYLPIGPIDAGAEGRIRELFRMHGITDRLRFLGRQSSPSQLARSMTLYLNEFPIGSGLALLDAMAAGLPIVSMYEPDGPHQARYAANAFGRERVITTGSGKDYSELACQLLQDPTMYAEWSAHARAAYVARGSPKAYVESLEESIKKHSL